MLAKVLHGFTGNRSANMSLLMAAGMAASMFVAANVIDYISLTNQKQTLQSLADRAAIASAQEMVVSQGSDARLTAVAQAYVRVSYSGEQTTTATILDNSQAVRVSITAAPRTFFHGPMASGVDELHAEAVAEVSGGGNICMIGLDPDAVATLKMSNSARLSAPKCAVYSNSRSPKSMWLANTARVSADMVCVAGGYQGPDTGFPQSAPTLDCPAINDPLRDRANPSLAKHACDYRNFVVRPLQDVRLRPGVYCGGITVMGGRARLDPGVYVMRDGQLNVPAGRLEGDNVGFFLTGKASIINFGRMSSVSLSAPRDGDMAGLLFFEDRAGAFIASHRITSQDARKLVGTIYLPKSGLLIDADNPVADRSDYTVIIARQFELREGPELVLNTDYTNSNIPLPEGVGNRTGRIVHLTQ
jgi:Flp pilus assembly protein TadG